MSQRRLAGLSSNFFGKTHSTGPEAQRPPYGMAEISVYGGNPDPSLTPPWFMRGVRVRRKLNSLSNKPFMGLLWALNGNLYWSSLES